jgi:hypothetical protein
METTPNVIPSVSLLKKEQSGVGKTWQHLPQEPPLLVVEEGRHASDDYRPLHGEAQSQTFGSPLPGCKIFHGKKQAIFLLV